VEARLSRARVHHTSMRAVGAVAPLAGVGRDRLSKSSKTRSAIAADPHSTGSYQQYGLFKALTLFRTPPVSESLIRRNDLGST
jgi:hypothetical protein